MPLEIEIKMKLESHAAVRSRLVAASAERVGSVRETNIFFDRPDRSLRAADSGLRVRLTTSPEDPLPKALLTFKGPAAETGLHSRESFDLHLTPHDQIVPLLAALGFERQYSFEKDRESWRLGGCLVELDVLPVFGCFAEIEGPSEVAVRAVQADLGLGDVPQYPKSYAKLVGEYLKQHNVDALRFVPIPSASRR